MTFRLLFPHCDKGWLKSQIKPPRQWPQFWKMSQEFKRDARLVTGVNKITAEISDVTHQKYDEDVQDTQRLSDLFPYWSKRLNAMYQEAVEPTAVTWWDEAADRRKDPRHAYKVAYLALILAIGFGLAATVIGALQLWIAYCQWAMPDGGMGCGARTS